MQLSSAMDGLVDRLALRNRLLRFGAVQSWRRRGIERRRAAFRRIALAPEAEGVVATIDRDGVAVLPGLHRLGAAGADVLLAELAQGGAAAWHWPPSRPLVESQAILDCAPAVYRIGLDPALLAFAEAYLGEPCLYMGCSMKREPVDTSLAGVRRWHGDIEDDRMLRLVIYLNAVEPGGGAFEYIDRPTSAAARQRLGYRSGYVSDEVMAAIVPRTGWREVHAPAGSVVAFDGVSVLHRVQRPTREERFSLSLTFTTRHPRQVLRPVRLHRRGRAALMPTIPEAQRACIPAARLL